MRFAAPRFVAALKLCRVEYWGFAYTGLVGALAVRGGDLPLRFVLPMLLCNVLFVAWTFAQNDVCDVEIDQKAPDLDERVLVRGDLSLDHAKQLITVLIVSMFTIGWLAFSARATAILAISAVFAVAYNLHSKRLLGSDLFYAASAAFGCLAGVVAASGSLEVSALAAAVVAITFVEQLFFNAIEGGLKDVATDRAAGAVTLAQRFVRLDGEEMAIAPAFRALALALKALSFGIAAFAMGRLGDDRPLVDWLALAGSGLVALAFTGRLVFRSRHGWLSIAKDLLAIEVASRMWVPLLLVPSIGWRVATLLICAPLAWFVAATRIVHARSFEVQKGF